MEESNKISEGKKEKTLKQKLILTFAGVLGLGFFLSFILQVNYGSDCCSFMNNSLAAKLNLSLGTTMVITSAICFIPQLIWGRKMIGIGTVANMVLVGYTCDFATWLENRYLPESLFTTIPARPVIFVITLVLFLISAALYMNADMGVSPFDYIPYLISEKTGISFMPVRICWDATAVIIGLLAGGKLTIATVVIAFSVGPMVSFIGKLLNGDVQKQQKKVVTE